MHTNYVSCWCWPRFFLLLHRITEKKKRWKNDQVETKRSYRTSNLDFINVATCIVLLFVAVCLILWNRYGFVTSWPEYLMVCAVMVDSVVMSAMTTVTMPYSRILFFWRLAPLIDMWAEWGKLCVYSRSFLYFSSSASLDWEKNIKFCMLFINLGTIQV